MMKSPGFHFQGEVRRIEIGPSGEGALDLVAAEVFPTVGAAAEKGAQVGADLAQGRIREGGDTGEVAALRREGGVAGRWERRRCSQGGGDCR